MDRYEKLYAAVDRVFAGTPNTPSALAAKTEILENLTAKYDDLLASGLSEAEAIRQTVDSIGDIAELFGSPVGQTAQSPAPLPTEPAPSPKTKLHGTYPPEKVRQGRAIKKALIAIAVALYILSLAAPVLSETNLSDNASMALMFGIWGLATAMIVGAGICLPWNNPTGKLLLALGVGSYIWAFVPMFLLAESSEGAAISVMFAGWAVATLLVILSTGFKRRGLPTADGKRIVVEHSRPGELPPDMESIYKPISTILLFVTLLIYLGVSFWTFGWAYTWIIWVIHGCFCEIVKAICWLCCKSRRDES